MPPSIDVLTSSSAPAWPTALMALKIPLPSPNVMVPKQSFETRRPVLPSVAYSMASFLSCRSKVSLGGEFDFGAPKSSVARPMIPPAGRLLIHAHMTRLLRDAVEPGADGRESSQIETAGLRRMRVSVERNVRDGVAFGREVAVVLEG